MATMHEDDEHQHRGYPGGITVEQFNAHYRESTEPPPVAAEAGEQTVVDQCIVCARPGTKLCNEHYDGLSLDLKKWWWMDSRDYATSLPPPELAAAILAYYSLKGGQ